MISTILSFALAGLVFAQAPAGTIAGVVRDPSGAVVPGVQVRVVSVTTGLSRTTTSLTGGDYSIPVLLPGEYEVRVEAAGFQAIVRTALVEVGATTTADLGLEVGNVTESITVGGAGAQLHYDSHTVGGLITREQIEGVPLNGRGFLELAKFEPGVQPASRGSNNRTFVPVLGAPGGNSGRGTRITVDGGSIMAVGNGGSAMGFSAEVVQEFQISSVNFDLSTGPTVAGAVNVVTRSGGNDLHGSAMYFFRDHRLAAYPALNRDPANPDPFFQRRQFGFALGGPIRRGKVFYFGNWERNEQRSVGATTLVTPEFVHFSRITPSPFFGNQLSMRLDGRISNAHTAFLRYSHDGNRAFGPSTLNSAGPNSYPSIWTHQSDWSDQSVMGLTSVLRPALVNDFRFSYFFISSKELAPAPEDCRGCLGIGAPMINVAQTDLRVGSSSFSLNLGRRFQFNDSFTWQKSTHRMRFGVDWENHRGGLMGLLNEPATITLYSPDQARRNGIPAPAEFRTLEDILALPLQSVTLAVGDPRVLQANRGLVRTWSTAQLFFQDTWRLHSRLTVNYGLGWNIDRNLNYDLSKPTLLAPILGAGGLGPTRKQWKNFSPVLGLAWTPSRDGKTVVRAGAGMYYDFLISPALDAERAALGPPGLGRQTIDGSSIPNTLPGIPGVPVGLPLEFRAKPTLFNGADLLSILPAIRTALSQSLALADHSVQQIQITKTQVGPGLNPMDLPTSSSIHVNVGIQRQVANDFVVGADLTYRHFIHLGFGADLNHFNSTRGPVIPVCTSAQRNDPQALCSTGPINVAQAAGRATYTGLLLRADKRLSHGFQVLGSYAYSSNTGTNAGNGFNLDNRLENRGPLATDFTHILNLAGVTHLPGQFDLGINFSYSSAPPFSAYVGGIDFNGDGTAGDLLPGSTVNAFNRGMGREDLNRLVTQFNQTYADKTDAKGVRIPVLTLPGHYAFDRGFHSLDLRLSRSFTFRERLRMTFMGEAFNLYNAANLSGYSGDLMSAAFGQPTARFSQIFGSGGARAFQLGTRVSF